MKTLILATALLSLTTPAFAHDHPNNGGGQPINQTFDQTFNQAFDQSKNSNDLEIQADSITYNNAPTYFTYGDYSAAVTSINFGVDSDLSAEHRVYLNIQVPLKSKVQKEVEKVLLTPVAW